MIPGEAYRDHWPPSFVITGDLVFVYLKIFLLFAQYSVYGESWKQIMAQKRALVFWLDSFTSG